MTNASFSTEPPWVPGFKQMKGKFAICQNLGRFFSFFKLNLSAFIWYALIIFLVSYWIKWKAENRIDASDKTDLKPSPYFHWLVESAWDMYILTIAFLFFRDFKKKIFDSEFLLNFKCFNTIINFYATKCINHLLHVH